MLDVHLRGAVGVRSIPQPSTALEGRGDAEDRVVSPVDAELMAERLETSGIRCDLHLWDGQIHDFPLAADVLPEGRRAIRYIGDFVK